MKTKRKKKLRDAAPAVVFRSAAGAPFADRDAPMVAAELTALYEQHHALRPADVVDRARPAGAPLHGFFTWDDSVAAEKCRRAEASQIIRAVVIVDRSMPLKEQGTIRAFYSVTADPDRREFEGRAYVPCAVVQSTPSFGAQVVTDALRELQSWQRRYDNLREFVGVYAEIKTVERELADA